MQDMQRLMLEDKSRRSTNSDRELQIPEGIQGCQDADASLIAVVTFPVLIAGQRPDSLITQETAGVNPLTREMHLSQFLWFELRNLRPSGQGQLVDIYQTLEFNFG